MFLYHVLITYWSWDSFPTALYTSTRHSYTHRTRVRSNFNMDPTFSTREEIFDNLRIISESLRNGVQAGQLSGQ